MKNVTAQGIEIVALTATFNGQVENAKADLYREPNKSYLVAVAAGTCAPIDAEFVGTQVLNPTATVATQSNYYTMLDDMGRTIGSVTANDLKEATEKARETRTPRFWKVKRCYNQGTRGL